MPESTMEGSGITDSVTEYYGKVLKRTEDLKTNACCTGEAPPPFVREALAKVHSEVVAKYYGCGLVLPQLMEGLRVLDLGCGAGRDVYMLAQFVGAAGSVIGVDMTEEQLEVANKYKDWHAEKFGYTNVTFHCGYIEKLAELQLPAESVDVIVSNCVINLSPDKKAVLAEAYQLLKTGGELYFSDVYSDRRVPVSLQKDEVLWGECISGALYWNDFIGLAKSVGFGDPRLVKDSPITVENKELEAKLGRIKFFSATYRLFKLPSLESDCEDYGQAVIYKGTVPQQEYAFELDGHHHIETGKVFPVCGNTYRMLHDTRFKPHFEFIGNWDRHYGIFDGCGKSLPFTSGDGAGGAGGSCC